MADMPTGVPGAGDGLGRSRGGSGKLMKGGKSQQPSGGVNFDRTSAQFNPSPRESVGKAAPHSTPPFPAPKNTRPLS